MRTIEDVHEDRERLLQVKNRDLQTLKRAQFHEF